MPFNTALFLPFEDRVGGQFCSIIADDRARPPASGDNPVQFPRYADARDRVINDRRQTFPAEVINDTQDTEPATVYEGVGHKV